MLAEQRLKWLNIDITDNGSPWFLYQINYMVISNNGSLYSDFYVALWAGYFPWLLAAL